MVFCVVHLNTRNYKIIQLNLIELIEKKQNDLLFELVENVR